MREYEQASGVKLSEEAAEKMTQTFYQTMVGQATRDREVQVARQ